MSSKISVNAQSSICVKSEKTIWFDPFKIESESNDADVIFITHDHFDHFSPEDISKVSNENTAFVFPESMQSTVKKQGYGSNILFVNPGKEYDFAGIHFETVPAYNIGKPFHQKENGFVGYVIEMNSERIYVSGDTDATDEVRNVKCDIALLPVGGYYTMNTAEAAECVNVMKPKKAVPTHYGDVVGKKSDGEEFKQLVDKNIKVEIIL